jgi:hypothetical protein
MYKVQRRRLLSLLTRAFPSPYSPATQLQKHDEHYFYKFIHKSVFYKIALFTPTLKHHLHWLNITEEIY